MIHSARIHRAVASFLVAAALIVPAEVGSASSASAAKSTAPSELTLVAETPSVTLDTTEIGTTKLPPSLDLGTFVADSCGPFELRATRRSYTSAIAVGEAAAGRTTPLRKGLVTDLAGLSDFFHVTIADSAGATVPDTTLNPSNTDLHSACGGISALSVREALATGWGDTYVQTLPGQSFDITDLPNGTYYVQVTANPDGALAESVPDDPAATSLREVVLGGTAGNRTVAVPPVGVVSG